MMHSLVIRVYWEDSDGGGVVYYANYLKFLERGRTELLRSLNLHQSQLHIKEHLVFVVSSLQIDYKIPAVLDDELQVRTRITEVKGACVWFEQEIKRGHELVAKAIVRVGCVDVRKMTPMRIPLEVKTRLQAMPMI